MNNRRKLIVALGAGALAAPFASFAQQSGKVWRVGFLTARRRPISLDSEIFSAFSRGMRELGYVEDKNLRIEWRFSEGRAELLPVLAAELVRMKVDVIVTSGTPATRAALRATALIPIVIGSAGDPVANGLVKSLAHPGGNVTGLSNITADLSPKLLEMLLSMVPRLARVAVVLNPDNPVSIKPLENVQAAARKTGVTILSITPRTPQEIENAFSRMAREKVGGLIVTRDALFIQQVRHIAELAIKIRLPSISDFREYPEAGGLMNYGSSIDDQYWRAATYVDKILKGAKPGDLPVEQPTKFELFINRKTANALGLTIPQSLLIMADKIIE
jgi:putative ABC transport system substrate-binding protein